LTALVTTAGLDEEFSSDEDDDEEDEGVNEHDGESDVDGY
jgi:hypothetical protein